MTLVKCDNCGWGGDETEAKEIKHLWERVSPGSPMPSGECPKCGTLCYEQEEPRLLDNVELESYAVVSTAHITKNDSETLGQIENTAFNMPSGILFVQIDEYHYRVKLEFENIDARNSLMEEMGFSSQFADLIEAGIADERICGFIFDRDGPIYDDLPQFEW